MIRIYFLALAGYALLSCQSSPLDKVNQSDLQIFLTDQVKGIDSGSVVKDFSVVKVDTISQRVQYAEILYGIIRQQTQNEIKVTFALKRAKLTRDMRDAYNGLSFSLYKSYHNQLKDEIDAAAEMVKKDSVLSAQRKEVTKRMNRADSLKPVAYLAVCAYKQQKANKSVVKDTGYVKLDTEFNIIDDKQYQKNLDKLYQLPLIL